MFLKQTSYKPRSNSQSAQDAATRAGQSAPAAAETSSPPPRKSVDAAPARKSTDLANTAFSAATAGRRRSSASSGTKFAGLHGYKRNSQDEAAAARKASFHEQGAGQGGVISGIWSNFTKGTGTNK